jgi:hypothetical protein
MENRDFEILSGGKPVEVVLERLKSDIWRAYQDWGHNFPDMWRKWADKSVKNSFSHFEIEHINTKRVC